MDEIAERSGTVKETSIALNYRNPRNPRNHSLTPLLLDPIESSSNKQEKHSPCYNGPRLNAQFTSCHEITLCYYLFILIIIFVTPFRLFTPNERTVTRIRKIRKNSKKIRKNSLKPVAPSGLELLPVRYSLQPEKN